MKELSRKYEPTSGTVDKIYRLLYLPADHESPTRFMFCQLGREDQGVLIPSSQALEFIYNNGIQVRVNSPSPESNDSFVVKTGKQALRDSSLLEYFDHSTITQVSNNHSFFGQLKEAFATVISGGKSRELITDSLERVKQYDLTLDSQKKELDSEPKRVESQFNFTGLSANPVVASLTQEILATTKLSPSFFNESEARKRIASALVAIQEKNLQPKVEKDGKEISGFTFLVLGKVMTMTREKHKDGSQQITCRSASGMLGINRVITPIEILPFTTHAEVKRADNNVMAMKVALQATSKLEGNDRQITR